jgi:CRISPR-associated protein Csx14
MSESTLICTLGGQPQVITFALDWLLRRGEQISDVFVFHLSPGDGRLEHSLHCLHRAFAGNRYNRRECRFRAIPVKQGGRLLPAISTEVEAEAVRQAVFALVADLKQAGRTLHLCIAGGPRMMGLMTLSAAGLFCGHADKVWHMHTDPAFRAQANEGAVMHDDSGEQVRLVPVPLVPWGSYLPPFMGRNQTPVELMSAQTAWMTQEERKRCQQVWQRLRDSRAGDVLRGFAAGQRPEEVAAALSISPKTVSSYNTRILAECRNAWDLPDDHYLNFSFVRDKFRDFFDQG